MEAGHARVTPTDLRNTMRLDLGLHKLLSNANVQGASADDLMDYSTLPMPKISSDNLKTYLQLKNTFVRDTRYVYHPREVKEGEVKQARKRKAGGEVR